MTGAGGHLASVDSSSLAAASAARPWFPALAAVDTIHPAARQTQVTQHLSAAHLIPHAPIKNVQIPASKWLNRVLIKILKQVNSEREGERRGSVGKHVNINARRAHVHVPQAVAGFRRCSSRRQVRVGRSQPATVSSPSAADRHGRRHSPSFRWLSAVAVNSNST